MTPISVITLGFNEAFDRLAAVSSVDQMEIELTNCLNHHYRLGELCAKRWAQQGPITKNQIVARQAQAPGAAGALWIRACDVHDLVCPAGLGDSYSDYYTTTYSSLVWEDVAKLPIYPDTGTGEVKMNDYKANLQGQPVLDTLRSAFDGLARFY